MSEDRIRRAFDDLSNQAKQANPDASLGELMNPADTPKNRWSYLAAAAVFVLVLGSVAAVLNTVRSRDVVSAPTTTIFTPESTNPSPNSTTPPDTGSTATTADTSTTPVDSAVAPTTTIPVVTNAVGWHVIDVASNDDLNVRQSPWVSSPVVATLAYNADDITVLPRAGNPIGGAAWYGVRLSDGTEGFVNSRFLAHPKEWDAGIASAPCTASQSSGDVSAPTPSSGDASAVVGLFQTSTGNCDRYVIVLGIDSVDNFETANVLGGGTVRVTSGGTRVSVELPSSITGVAPQATNADFSDALALTVLPINTTGAPDDLEVRFLHSSSRVAGVTVLSNPARIVVDVAMAPTGTGLDYTPVIGTGNTLLEHPVDQSADKVGVATSFSVTGYARWFEGQGFATVLRPDDGRPADIVWSGPSLSSANGVDSDGYRVAMDATVLLNAPYIPTWGEFTFSLDLFMGPYELFVGESCTTSDGNSSNPCGVTESFLVAR